MKKKIEVEAKEVVTQRLNVQPLDDYVAEFLDELRLASFDMANADDREKIRQRVRRWLCSVLRRTIWDLRKGSERGMDQILALMDDVNYYETVKKRRRRAREHQTEYREKERRKALERRPARGAVQ